jgi:hypothetical protein
MPADAAYQLVADVLNLDGKTAFDLGSFTATWMEPEAEKLIITTTKARHFHSLPQSIGEMK